MEHTACMGGERFSHKFLVGKTRGPGSALKITNSWEDNIKVVVTGVDGVCIGWIHLG